MKRINLNLLIILLAIVIGVGFASCSSDDESGSSVGSLNLHVTESGITSAKVSGTMSLNELMYLYLQDYTGDFPYRDADVSTLDESTKQKLIKLLLDGTSIQYSQNEDFSPFTSVGIPQVSDGKNFEVTLTGLAPNTTYYYRIRVWNGSTSNYTSAGKFTTDSFDMSNISVVTGTAKDSHYLASSKCSINVEGNKVTIKNFSGISFEYGILLTEKKSQLENITISTINAVPAYFENYNETQNVSNGNFVVSYSSKNFSSMALDRGKTYYYTAYVSLGSFSPIFIRGEIKSIKTE